jgi:hypothetical protein
MHTNVHMCNTHLLFDAPCCWTCAQRLLSAVGISGNRRALMLALHCICTDACTAPFMPDARHLVRSSHVVVEPKPLLNLNLAGSSHAVAEAGGPRGGVGTSGQARRNAAPRAHHTSVFTGGQERCAVCCLCAHSKASVGPCCVWLSIGVDDELAAGVDDEA